jgi:hypothetical protein
MLIPGEMRWHVILAVEPKVKALIAGIWKRLGSKIGKIPQFPGSSRRGIN